MTQLFMVHPGPLDRPGPAVPSPWQLRTAIDSDAGELADALSDAFDERWSAARAGTELLAAADVTRTWVVTAGPRILATASERLHADHADAGYVHWVGVRRESRGHALGVVVTQACLSGFAGDGYRRAVLETDDFRIAAVRTYLRLGFVREYRSDAERSAWSTLLRRLYSPPAVSEVRHGEQVGD